MSGGFTKWVSTFAGLIATSAGLVVMVSLPSQEATPDPVASPPATIAQVLPEATELVTEPTTTTLPAVEGVAEEISDALTRSGYTEFVPADDLTEILPGSVVDVLIANDVVLVVADEDEQ